MLDFRIVLITVSNREEAVRLAEGLVQEHLAACVNIVPNVESIYRWEGEIQHEQECLLICKTIESCWPALEAWVIENHSYTVPEILQLPILEGSSDYLEWVLQCLEK